MASAQLISPAFDGSQVHDLDLFQSQSQPAEVSVFQSACYVHIAKDKKPFAVLDMFHATVLEELDRQGFQSLSYQAYYAGDCEEGDDKKIPEVHQNSGKNRSFKVDLNIYGPRSNMHELGRLLSKKKVCLQQPLHLDSTFEYDNPHYFTCVGQRTPWVETETGDGNSGKSGGPSMKQLLSNILENQLSHTSELRELESDARIKTRLLR